MWSAELQEPAAHSAIDQIEVFAHLSNGQVLLAHELDDLAFVVRIKVATAAAFFGEHRGLQCRCFMGFCLGLRLWRRAAQRSQTFERCHCAHASPQCVLQLGDRCGVALQHMQCFREAIDGALA